MCLGTCRELSIASEQKYIVEGGPLLRYSAKSIGMLLSPGVFCT